MSKLSVIMPSRNSDHVSKTVEDIFSKATGEIEVIVVLDGYWPKPSIPDRNNLIIVHSSISKGLKPSIIMGAQIATGKYVMKCDDHCMFAKGFDEVLKSYCDTNHLVVPRRYSLDADNWKLKNDRFVDYLYLTYPYLKDEQFGFGFHGRKWTGATRGKRGFYEPERLKADIPIDEIMSFQGSCWFMPRDFFLSLNVFDMGLDKFYQEPMELLFKIWEHDGRIYRNKKTWYAHWHKNRSSGYNFSKKSKYEIEQAVVNRWMGPWLKPHIDRFWPLPGWPEDWYEHTQKN